MLWGGFARVFLVHHVTWSINSVCHLWGRKEFKTEDESRNNAFCALFSFGEGWHNNHHAFPTSARHGLRWWQFDITWILICALNAVGLVWDIRTPDARQLEERSAANVAARAAAGAASAATSIAELTEPAEQAAQAESQINEADRAA
jgi:stearoyl-CoA desaturase (delta-9 desaturase)